MKLLLLSNSTNVGEDYLGYSKKLVKEFLDGDTSNIIFIPYAAVTFSYDEYEEKVNTAWEKIGLQVKGIHHYNNPVDSINKASVIVIGGGNTWKLTKLLNEYQLMDCIKEKVKSGTPYIGWSAGSNVACPTLRTTNDMPILYPNGFNTLNLIPFQINPHYLDDNPTGHGGETREQRIEEFIKENHQIFVVGLREGSILKYENNKLQLLGNKFARIFKYGEKPKELCSSDSFDFLFVKNHL